MKLVNLHTLFPTHRHVFVIQTSSQTVQISARIALIIAQLVTVRVEPATHALILLLLTASREHASAQVIFLYTLELAVKQ